MIKTTHEVLKRTGGLAKVLVVAMPLPDTAHSRAKLVMVYEPDMNANYWVSLRDIRYTNPENSTWMH